MLVDLFPFRYSAKLSKGQVMRRIASVAIRHELRRSSMVTELFPGYSRASVKTVERDFELELTQPRLRQRKLPRLSAVKMAILSRRFKIDVCRYSAADDRVVLTVELAKRNEYPGLGVEVWLKSRFMRFGGFIQISAKSDKKSLTQARAIAADIRRQLAVPQRASN
jgi:hypothetical protein